MNVADLLVSGFIFLLFVSIYRKRSTPAVRFWVAGWFFVLLHFAALVARPASPIAETAQAIAALCTLVLCGTAFALSYEPAHTTSSRQVWVGSLLGVPWLLTMIFGSLDGPGWYLWAAGSAICSLVCTLGVYWRLFAGRRLRLIAGAALVAGCACWLIASAPSRDAGTAVSVVLTLCFGLNAILLTRDVRKPSAATLTTSIGAFAWGAVWVCASLVERFAPGFHVVSEVWNLPKYFVASGMLLGLLEGEIRSAELANEEYRLLFAGNPHPMWIYSPDTLAFLDVNDAAVAHYGFSKAEFRAMTVEDVTHANDPEALNDLKTDEPQKLSGPWLHRRKDGSEFQVDIASQPVLREGQRATFALIHDVTEPQRLHAQLIRQAHHDVLTDLPNRALFEQRLQETLGAAARTGAKAALLCIDLDRFKQINDTYGHAAGDECLREMSKRINQRLGVAGILARTGGDEFMLALGNLGAADEAERFADALLEDLKPWVSLERGEVELVASIGIAIFPDDGRELTPLWRDADAAMYRAKRAGGAQWVRVSEEISNTVSEANEIELSLRRALKSGGFEVYYQPQMTSDGRLHSLEALVRCSEGPLARTSPERFIPIAEESGLIVPIGDWVLETVCRQSREWMDEGREPVQIAVNVSPLQLARMDFHRKVSLALERYRLSPRMLEFEVTESTVMSDRGDAPHQIAMLARMGIRFSVDDFGTGYSSLGRLHQLPVESLKIDRSFTRRIAERKGTYPTVRAIIALAHTFGMNVVAEGVETEEQLRILRSLECDRVQGYLFSRPVPAAEVVSFLPERGSAPLQQAIA